jgi:hypothetical protein
MEKGDPIKTLLSLDFASKSIAVSVFILMPFWFVALYLFKRAFIIQNPFYYVAIFCFCFAIGWYAVVFFIYSTFYIFRSGKQKGLEAVWMPELQDYRNVFFFSISGICLVICFTYIIFYNQSIPFWVFLLNAVGFLTVLSVVQATVRLIITYSRKRK